MKSNEERTEGGRAKPGAGARSEAMSAKLGGWFVAWLDIVDMGDVSLLAQSHLTNRRKRPKQHGLR